MSACPDFGSPRPVLAGSEGELVAVRISIEPRFLERLLDALAYLDFPINPEIRHAAGPVTVVEFPAWSARVPGIRGALSHAGLAPDALAVVAMLDAIRGGRAAARAIA